jgi:chemotaxis response regulator CheB
MSATQNKPRKPGVMMIGFSPVIRQGLQAILIKDQGIEVVEETPDGAKALANIKLAPIPSLTY